MNYEDLAKFLEAEQDKAETFSDLSRAITKFIIKVNKKVVLMIDEVDKSSNNQLFLSFLGMLRNRNKEVKGGDEKRFNIVITYEKRMYIIELKIWRGEKYHEKVLLQLGEYLEQYGLDDGYLLVFDLRKVKGKLGKVDEIKVRVGETEKKVVEVYC